MKRRSKKISMSLLLSTTLLTAPTYTNSNVQQTLVPELVSLQEEHCSIIEALALARSIARDICCDDIDMLLKLAACGGCVAPRTMVTAAADCACSILEECHEQLDLFDLMTIVKKLAPYSKRMKQLECIIDRRSTVSDNLDVAGNLSVAGTSTFANDVFLQAPANESLCLVFKQDTEEKARICGHDIPGDHGVYISVDAGTTRNLDVKASGTVAIAQPAAGAALEVNGLLGNSAIVIQPAFNSVALEINDSGSAADIRINGASAKIESGGDLTVAANTILSFETNGIERARIYEDGAFQIGSQQNPATLGVYGSALIGGDVIVNNKIGAGVQPQQQLHIAQNARVDGQFLAADGSAQAPSYSFANSTNTGIYRLPENSVAISTNGIQRVSVTNAGEVAIAAPQNAAAALTVFGAAEQPVIKANGNGNSSIVLDAQTGQATIQAFGAPTTRSGFIAHAGCIAGHSFVNDGEQNNLLIGSQNALRVEVAAGRQSMTIDTNGRITFFPSNDFFTAECRGQFNVTESTQPNKQVMISYDPVADHGRIEAIEQGVSFKPLALAPRGGNVHVGSDAVNVSLTAHGPVTVAPQAGLPATVTLQGTSDLAHGVYITAGSNTHSIQNSDAQNNLLIKSNNGISAVVNNSDVSFVIEPSGSVVVPHTLVAQTTVGIGTATPAESLHVANNTRVDGKILVADGSFNQPALTFTSDISTGIAKNFYGGLSLCAAGHQGLSVDNNGFVVILPSITGPSGECRGQFNVTEQSAFDKQVMISYDAATDCGRIEAVHQNVSFKSLALAPRGGSVHVGSDAVNVSLTAHGPVTVTPQAGLPATVTLQGTSDLAHGIYIAAGTNTHSIQNSDAQNNLLIKSNNGISAVVNNSDVSFVIEPSGSVVVPHTLVAQTTVGIGTATPAESLHVANNARVDGKILVADGSFNQPALTFTSDTSTGIAKNFYGGLSLCAAGHQGLSVDNNGFVVILPSITGPSGECRGQFNVTEPVNINKQIMISYDPVADHGRIEAIEQGVSFKTLALAPRGGNVQIGAAGSITNERIYGTSTIDPIGFGPGNTALAVTNGDIFVNNGNVVVMSDRRVKQNISPLSNKQCFDLIAQLEPVSFVRKNGNNVKEHGFIAQDYKKVCPHCVAENNEGLLGVATLPLIPDLVGAIKYLDATYKIQVEMLMNKINELMQRVEQLEKEREVSIN